MTISDFKGEEALDLLMDILDDATAIFMDKEVQKAFSDRKGKTWLQVAQPIVKKHKKSVINILARVNNIKPKEYDKNLFGIIADCMELAKDPDTRDFFLSLV